MTELQTLMPWLPTIAYLAAAAMAAVRRDSAWRPARVAASLAVIFGLADLIDAGLAASRGARVDWVGTVLLVLVTFLGWVIVRFSHRYLRGEPGQPRYVVALLVTLGAVTAVAATDHLGWLVLAWSVSSLGLHSLLTFYPDRPAAQIVAHKKFIASRCAELCLVAALLLVHREVGSLEFARIADHVASLSVLPASLQVAAALVALAALLKSAQLPVHGWLLQVMEAPTPVSALLHAGIVNIAGFVIIRLAGLMSGAPLAEALLVVVGAGTAALAGLVTLTRISIKVRLAWSTCAQMGFMLMECGLGLYDLALLHLVAHSLYKAHAFLTSGEAVLSTRLKDWAPQVPAPAGRLPMVARQSIAVLVAAGLVLASQVAWQLATPDLQVPYIALWIVALGLAPLLARAGGVRSAAGAVASVALLTQAYFVWHLLFTKFAPAPVHVPAALNATAAIVFGSLYFLQSWVTEYPEGGLARRLHPWAYAGFYLDERFTRAVFRIWPARFPGEGRPVGLRRYVFGERQ